MYRPDKNLIWLIRGAQRRLLFLNLPKDAFVSNKLRKELNEKLETSLSLREMSRHLRDFEEKGFVQCINKTDPYNKIYSITNKGLKIQQKLKGVKNL
ncbi:MAG: hypothetical protein NT076_05365 [Candidatus Pacearchaeota archaeon]|nr:hypothetical protein [Candidatus Pacearchaeota archaeon]